jgi:23S rRNA (guanosine2251-2'-O)-methyltransferase
MRVVKAEILYGFHSVYEALRAGRRTFEEIYVGEEKRSGRVQRIVLAAARKNLPIQKVDAATLKTIAGSASHQGIAAKVTPYPLADVDDLIDRALSGGRPALIVLLDNIVDPHNLGAILRTAVCVGADGVIIPKDRSAFPTPAVSRISSGALEYIRLAQVNNIVRVIQALKDRGVFIVGLDQNAADSIFTTDLTGATGLVVGGEEKGIRPLIKKKCNCLISIPQKGPVSSLNASVAGAVVMYESFRQRRAAEIA